VFAELEKSGFPVTVLNSKEAVDEFVKEVLNG
jgi:hypothetical protein